MLIIVILALICGAISILFIASEINESLDNFNRLCLANTGIKKFTLLWKWPLAFKRLAMDVAITTAIVWLFSMAGMVGMMVSLMASGIVSANLWARKKKMTKREVI